MALSKRSKRGIRAFAKIQSRPTKVAYLISHKTRTDVLVAAYNEVKK